MMKLWRLVRRWFGIEKPQRAAPAPEERQSEDSAEGIESSRDQPQRDTRELEKRYTQKSFNEMLNSLDASADMVQRIMRPGRTTGGKVMETIGATIGPIVLRPNQLELVSELDRTQVHSLPSFGLIAMTPGEENTFKSTWFLPSMLGWYRIARGWPGVEVWGEHEQGVMFARLYEVAHRKRRGKWTRIWEELPVAFNPATKQVRQLRSLQYKQWRDKYGQIHTRKFWGVKPMFEKRPGVEEEPFGPFSFLCFAVNSWAQRDMSWQVIMKKGGRRITWLIEQNEAKLWFKNRITVPTTDGRRKRILHEVVAHERKTVGGVTFVRPHLRGEQNFKWRGHDVTLAIPYRDAPMMSTFTSEVHDVEQPIHDPEMLTIYKACRKMACA